MSETEKKLQIQSCYIPSIFGKLDEHIQLIEKQLHVKFVLRDDELKVLGDENQTLLAAKVINKLIHFAQKGQIIDTQLVEYTLSSIKNNKENDLDTMSNDLVATTYLGKPIKAKTIGQKKYIENMKKNKCVYFGAIGGLGAKLSMCIKNQKIIAYESLGTEALREIYVEKFPAIVIINCDGESIYERDNNKYE